MTGMQFNFCLHVSQAAVWQIMVSFLWFSKCVLILQRELEKTHSKKLLDNSDDDDDDESEEEVEELTHFGQSLSEMENFKDPLLSDIDDDSDDGRINGKTSTFFCLPYDFTQ